ncbi:MAG: hypothetical protein QOD77_1163 [Thermoplasmata archaeon]|jgi:hypothetical protein|nr:hypothetical protein [Thermoplasmata archaeon]
MRFGAPVAMALLLLAGCSGSQDDTFACPDGTILTLSDDAPADPASLCPQPVAPSVSLGAVSYNATVYLEAKVSWTVSNGSYPGGHSMYNSVRLAHHPTPLDQVKKMEDYGVMELAVKEHQNLPAAGPFNGTFTLTTPGTFYLRAYARIYADGLPEKEYWSAEVPIKVSDIATTGTLEIVTHAAGDFAGGGLDKNTVDLVAGDALEVKNDDVLDHAYTLKNGPVGSKVGDIVVARLASSGAFILKIPGTYTWESDDVQKETLTANVGPPA